ncbi:zinc-finger-containing protein [Paenibacillus illinoisensis]|uniref:zinc-finger-containing protein n=1 Tax=Paenibacillus illinoisensis TaxID=59845 RepID=UPI003AFB6443
MKFYNYSEFCQNLRTQGYMWLSNYLNLEPAQCHIGLMDSEACERVINLCKPYIN